MMMIKYKTGSIVEVFVSHSWRCAQVLSRNGLHYTVSYDVYPGFTNKAGVECVSVESIRPCPPLLEISKSWVCGDAVEVFHHLSWKLATVLKDCGCDQFLVRLVGSLQEFDVSGSEIRVSQKYQNGEWVEVDVTIPRVFNAAGGTKVLFKCDKDSGLGAKQGNTKPLKRALSCCDSEDEGGERRPQKFRVFEKEGRRLRLLETSPEKVDAVANRKENLNGIFCSSRALALEINDTHSVMSSSGSCSSNSYKPNEVYSGPGPVEDFEVYESDVESVCQLRDYEDTDQSPMNEALADEIHGLELKAYRCTVEELYESGTITWEEDARITSLRMSLNISENEHLSILKCLIYASGHSIGR